MARLEELLGQAAAGRGHLVFVSGEAGIGKSRLVTEFAGTARAAGARILRGRASPTGMTTPLRPFIEALQSAVEPAELQHPSLKHYRALLDRLFAAQIGGARADAPSLAVTEAVLRLLREMASRQTLVLVIEDVHSADPETLEALDYLADKIENEPILSLATDRDEPDSLAGNLIVSLTARRAAERIQLQPFTPDETQEFISSALELQAVPSDLAESLMRRTSGNPFLIEEMLGIYLDSGGAGAEGLEFLPTGSMAERIPLTYLESLRDRLQSLDSEARQIVFAAAVIGNGFDPRLLPPIVELSQGDVSAGLKNAIHSQLLTTSGDHFAGAYGFRHALARESILAELLPDERAILSLRAANAIQNLYQELPGKWCERAARLYEEGGALIDAARLLQESARRALSRSALLTAESALLHARTLVPSDWMMWLAIDELLLDVYVRSGKTIGLLEQGRRLLDVYLGRYGGFNARRHIAEIHLKIARGVLGGDDWQLAGDHVTAARETVEQDYDASLHSQISALSSRVAFAANRLEEADKNALEALETAGNASPQQVCDALDARALSSVRQGRLDEGRTAWSRVLTLSDDPKLAIWKVRALLGLGSIDVYEKGDDSRLSSARSAALDIGALGAYAEIELQSAWALLARPDLASSVSHLDRCEDLTQVHGFRLAGQVTQARCMLAALQLDKGKLQDLREKEAAEGSLGASVLGNGDAVLAVAEGDDTRALKHLETAADERSSDGGEWWMGLGYLLDAVFRENDDARVWFAGGARLPIDRGYESYGRAVILGRKGEVLKALDAFAQADLVMPPGWRRHHARRVVANAALDAGWGDPVTWAGEAIEFFDRAQLPGLTTTCRALLRRAGAPVRRRGRGQSLVPAKLQSLGITSREMDVFKLVGERLSNGEIAERLFVSPRTVETHIANLQRKTQASDRKELIDFVRSGSWSKSP